MRTARRMAASCLAWPCLVTALWLTPPSGALAQGDPGATQDLVEEAVGEYNAGRYAEARALFRRAHEMEPNARTLRGLGMASFELREYVDALRALEAALVSEERALTDRQRQHVRGLIERAKAYVGRYRVELAPEDAELFVDDAAARLEEDGSLLLNLGAHSIEARCPGCEAVRRAVRVRGGEDETLTFDLRAETRTADDPERVAAPSEAGGTAIAPPRGHARDDGSPGGVLLLVGAGVLLVGSAAGALWWLDRNDELDRCEQAGDACRNQDTLSGERGAAAVMTVGLGVAAVGALVGGLILLGDDDSGEVAMACVPGWMGVSCAGSF